MLRLIGTAYEAAENPAQWSVFLEHYANAMDAYATFFQVHRLAARSSQMITVFGLTPRFKASYNEHYGRINLWRNRGRQRFVQGRAVLDHEVCSRSDLVNSEFYNDYLVPMRGEHSAGGVVKREGDDALMLGAMRDRRRGAFDESERRAIEVLLPHVTRAEAIGKRLAFLHAEESALDSLDVAIAFLTGTGELLHGNRSAERILDRDDGLCVRSGVLSATDSGADARIRQAIREAISAETRIASPLAIGVPRPSGHRAYQLLLAPIRHGLPMLAGLRAPDVVLLIIDPESQRTGAPQLLVQLYGLTRREAALASTLCAGKTVGEAAQELHMTYETARSHLRRIFEKTGTSRQTELLRLLMRLPGEPTKADTNSE
jgi:DNA-binding CsgD family transcriptional regulator/PAS domain-containing protein